MMRLLPPGHELSWTPFGHLIYLIFFLAQPIFAPEISYERWWTLLGLLIFLVAYFRGYWLSGYRVLGPIAVLCGLGSIFAIWNAGASSLFIYAAAFAAQIGPPRRALRLTLLIVVISMVVAATYQTSLMFWGPALLFSPLVAGINIHYRSQRLADAKLRQSREEVERLAKVAERERIARDLHDLLGHTLSTIILKAELASKLATRDAAKAAEEMKEVERISRLAMKEVRTAVAGYKSRSLAVELIQVRAALAAAGVMLELDFDPESDPAVRDLDPRTEGVLSMALREAVTNVIRHSEAERCYVSLRKDDCELHLEVSDDGVGARAPEGSGLAGMRERLASLGGELERVVRDGTTLRIRLPAAEAVGGSL
ncbi:MAG: sensor histidine kinase [Thermoanaerobaculia bacterium]|nr:sensor histidine kinase [Thermoanaerobaculia bacterium]